ncbi:MAG: hypothetical protein ABID09_05025 [Candidatus Omnitrophota bacterium]
MKKGFCIFLILVVAVYFGQLSFAKERGGKDRGGKAKEIGIEDMESRIEYDGAEYDDAEYDRAEHGDAEPTGEVGESHMKSKGPSVDDIRETMTKHVMDKSASKGTFDVVDEETGKTRHLALGKIRQRVGKTGDYYYSCADFTDVDSGEMLDVDLDVEDRSGSLSVVEVRVHKVDGKQRYTYDENDNRIPVEE